MITVFETKNIDFQGGKFPLLKMQPKRGKWYFWDVSQDFFFMHISLFTWFIEVRHDGANSKYQCEKTLILKTINLIYQLAEKNSLSHTKLINQ